MLKLIFRQEAINDLTEIWNYTLNEWSESQADKYYDQIKFACKEISENPNVGKIYPEISKKLSGFKTGKHIIFYHLISEDEIEIIRILHERMELKNRLNQ